MTRVVAESNVELAQQSRSDRLTGLLNRGAWEEAADLECDRNERSQSEYSLLMIDVDHFKSFNDSKGHQAGDECLRQVAEIVRRTCRFTDIVGRYGGEEFVVLASDSDEATALRLAEDICRAVSDLKILHPAAPTGKYVTVSVGVSGGGESWSEALKRADDALYVAKREGRECVRGAARVAVEPVRQK
jgi:diguanylate cyclase (GGDEF)-like protein